MELHGPILSSAPVEACLIALTATITRNGCHNITTTLYYKEEICLFYSKMVYIILCIMIPIDNIIASNVIT